MRWLRAARAEKIDRYLAAQLHRRLTDFHVYVKELPRYRFIDLYRAAEHHAQSTGIIAVIESDHRDEYLRTILHSKPSRWISRRTGRSGRVAWPVGPGEETFLPVDVFWICGV